MLALFGVCGARLRRRLWLRVRVLVLGVLPINAFLRECFPSFLSGFLRRRLSACFIICLYWSLLWSCPSCP